MYICLEKSGWKKDLEGILQKIDKYVYVFFPRTKGKEHRYVSVRK